MNDPFKDWDKLTKEQREELIERMKKAAAQYAQIKSRPHPAFKIFFAALMVGCIVSGFMTNTWFAVIGGILGILAVITSD